jgi:lysophospholipase L1-like esterase
MSLSLRLLSLASLVLSGFAPPASGAPQFTKVLFLGNSITLHGPKADIAWTGNWGMAASALENDYVHLVSRALAERSDPDPGMMVKNIADFERAYVGYDFAAKLKEQIGFQPDLIILAIGENVPALKTAGEEAAFLKSVTALLTTIKGERAPTILVRSSFWANPAKDKALATACASVGGIYVDISALGKDEANYARSERDYKHAGVANHPGDKGMAAIADAIVRALPQ